MLTNVFFLFVLIFVPIESSYIITTPKRWTKNHKTQVCVMLTKGLFLSEDSLKYTLKEFEHEEVLSDGAELPLVTGKARDCFDVEVPSSTDELVTLTVTGSLDKQPVDFAVNVTFTEGVQRTFIQTDKYLYKPGQKVQFRVLSVLGPTLEIVTNNYEEIYVESPSHTRIAQWLNVDNSRGLIHLDFDLFNEADDGTYTIAVKLPGVNFPWEKEFRIEDYVLPRYEVTVTGPPTVLGSDESVTVTLCAKYTFGQPVHGNATLSLVSGHWRNFANITQSKKISGCGEFTFSSEELLLEQNNCHIRINNLKAFASLIEDGTGVELKGSSTFAVHRQALNFKEITSEWVKKPYLPYPIRIVVTFADGKPAKKEKMEVCTSFHDEDVCKNLTTNSEGHLAFLMPSQTEPKLKIRAVNYPKIERNWNEVMEASTFRKYGFYPSREYVNINKESLSIFIEDELKCTTGQDVHVKVPVIYVVKDKSSANIQVQVLSRGQIILMKTMQVEFNGSDLPFGKFVPLLPLEILPKGFVRGSFDIPLRLSESVSPRLTILVWYSDSSNVVVADKKEIKVSECLPHKVTMSWSTAKTKPGGRADLHVSAAKDALCSIGVVDRSVELLSSENRNDILHSLLELTESTNYYRRESNQINVNYCYRKYGFEITGTGVEEDIAKADSNIDKSLALDRYSTWEALHMFNEAGYNVISDLFLDKVLCNFLIINDLKDYSRPHHIAMSSKSIVRSYHSSPRIAAAPSQMEVSYELDYEIEIDNDSLEPQGSARQKKERKYLPETWLWRLQPLPTGKLAQTVTLPDTVTEWRGRAVCVHPDQGVGLSSSSSITTFTPFFVDLTLPPSAKRGEILPVKVSVFNYLDDDLPVKVSLEASEDYSFAEGESGERRVCIPAHSKSVETIRILLTRIGDVNITVDASSQPLTSGSSCGSATKLPLKEDRLIKSFPVEAEGYMRERTWTKYICEQDMHETPVSAWHMEIPKAIVEGSERAWITVMGDLLGPSLENIGNIVAFPSGCGEQNMVNFSPNVYILQYLEASGQVTDSLRSKILKFLVSGYQKQLSFLHRDGYYSAFGSRDQQGSTWLTAFVVKSYSQAKPFINIDQQTHARSVMVLTKSQREDGCFDYRGRVVNKMLLGGLRGTGSSEALMTAYILTALLEEGSFPATAISSAVRCIERDASDHPYSLALKAYSLALAGMPSAKKYISSLLATAVSNSSDLRWDLPDRNGQETSLHVETAAYALLSLVTSDAEAYADQSRKIVRWLSAMRNGQGGFISTQDTVVALQALAAFEKALPTKHQSVAVLISAPGLASSLFVVPQNKLLQQMVQIPTVPSPVEFTVTGRGCSVVQGVVRYNVLADSPADAFDFQVEVDPGSNDDCKTRVLRVCARYSLPDEASNMAIIEVRLVSGFVASSEDLRRQVDQIQNVMRYEVEGSKVVFYLDEIDSELTCVSFRVRQEIEVGNAKPGVATVYDYYQPEYTATQKFHLNIDECEVIP